MTGSGLNISAACEEIARLDIEIEGLEQRMKALALDRDILKASLIQEVQNGSSFQKESIGGRTIYVATVRRPKPLRSRAQLVEALKRTELKPLIKEDYNENSLYSATSEWVKAAARSLNLQPNDMAARALSTEQIIPELLREVLREDLSLAPKFEIRVTR